MSSVHADVWKSEELTRTFLTGVRGAIPLAQQQIDVMLRLIAASKAPERVLDLGCGDGVLAGAIHGEYPTAEFVLMDFSAPMLDAARKRFDGTGAAIHVIVEDYGRPEWVHSVQAWWPFDAIVSGYSIHHQDDDSKRRIYREIFSLLSPGGVFVNVEHVSSRTAWIEKVHDELFIDHLQKPFPGKSRESVAAEYYYRPDKAANQLSPVEDQCAWLREIGYADVDCFLKVFELALFGGRRA